MESRVDRAAERHLGGYNCAQAVACAYADLVGMDEEDLFRATEGLGRGMGGMDGTCGAVSGACVLVGLATSDGSLGRPASKRESYRLSEEIVSRFEAAHGATTCRDLKGADTGRALCPCAECITSAASIVEDVLFSGR